MDYVRWITEKQIKDAGYCLSPLSSDSSIYDSSFCYLIDAMDVNSDPNIAVAMIPIEYTRISSEHLRRLSVDNQQAESYIHYSIHEAMMQILDTAIDCGNNIEITKERLAGIIDISAVKGRIGGDQGIERFIRKTISFYKSAIADNLGCISPTILTQKPMIRDLARAASKESYLKMGFSPHDLTKIALEAKEHADSLFKHTCIANIRTIDVTNDGRGGCAVRPINASISIGLSKSMTEIKNCTPEASENESVREIIPRDTIQSLVNYLRVAYINDPDSLLFSVHDSFSKKESLFFGFAGKIGLCGDTV